MKSYVITLFGLPLSETRARRCITSGEVHGLKIGHFPAISRYEAVAAMEQAGLKLNRRIYAFISDQPIGDRSRVPRGKWHLTTPELGCFMSHFSLWQRCIQLDQPIVILEHDVILTAAVPEIPPRALALNLYRTEEASTVAYVLSPRAARLAVKETRRRGIQPADELLWRAALRSRPTAMCPESLVRHEDGGISTIQFTRRDERHEGVSDTDPWQEFLSQRQ